MIYIGFPGEDVPRWLELVYPTPGHEHEVKIGTVRFGSLVLVWAWKGRYYVRRPFNLGCLIRIENCSYITMAGQYPGYERKPVMLDMRPIIPDGVIGALMAFATLWLLLYRGAE